MTLAHCGLILHRTTHLASRLREPKPLCRKTILRVKVSPGLPPINRNLPINNRLAFSWSFAQGFVIGQLSVIIVVGAFIKYFIFGEPSGDGPKSLLPSSTQRRREKARGIALAQPPTPPSRIASAH